MVQTLTPARPVSQRSSLPPLFSGYKPSYDLITPSNMRKVIAKRLVEAKQSIPHFYVAVDCEMDAL